MTFVERALGFFATDPQWHDVADVRMYLNIANEHAVDIGQSPDSRNDLLPFRHVMRLAERGLAVAVLNGQAAGLVRAQREKGTGGRPKADGRPALQLTSPDEAFRLGGGVTIASRRRTECYLFARYSLEAFSSALERNWLAGGWLTRAEIVRELDDVKPEPVRHELLHKTRRPDSRRIVESTATTVTGLASGLALVDFRDLDGLPPDELGDWHARLVTGVVAMKRVIKELSKRAE